CDPDVGLLVPKQVVGDRSLAVTIIGPAMVGAHQAAIDDLTFRELEMAVSTAILDRTNAPILTAKHRDRSPPELRLQHLPGRERGALFDRVPVVRIEAGSTHFLSARACRFETRRRTGSVPVEHGHEDSEPTSN